MTLEDTTLERLRAHVDELAAGELATLLAEARVEARAKVRTLLVEAIAERMLAHAEASLAGELDGKGTRERPAEPRVQDDRAQERETSRETEEFRAASDAPPQAERRAGGPLGWYVYGVVGEGFEETEDIPGIDGEHPVTVVPAEGVAAVASRVPLSEFGEDVLDEQVNDLDWLERSARRHDSILDRIRERTTLVPMRLCTIYNTDSSVREMLTREHEFLVDALRRLEGRTEWGVKLFANGGLPDGEDEPSAQAQESAPHAGPGAAYMLHKRAEGIRRAEAETLLEEACAAIHLRLSAAAAESKLNPLQPRELSKRDEQMLLNGVYLVEDRVSGEFARAVAALQEEYAAQGVDIELTGPWPPYNFVNDASEVGR